MNSIPMNRIPLNAAECSTVSSPESQSTVAPGQDRHLELLHRIAEAGGQICPTPDPYAPNGHRFDGLTEESVRDLAYLARRDYLEERFFERVSLCPKCGSHHLNIRETCPSCGSAKIHLERLLHHYRCGFVGAESAFAERDGARICPKCDVALKHVGTDHDPIGRSASCGACGASFHDPAASAACMSCGTTTDAGSLASIDLNSYHLTGLGQAALRRGTLFESEVDPLHLPDLPLFRPHVIHELLEQECRRLKRSAGAFTLLAIAVPPGAMANADDATTTSAVRAVAADLRETDVFGLLDDRTVVALLPATDRTGAEWLCRRLKKGSDAVAALLAESRIIEIRNPADLGLLSSAPAS